MFTDRNCCAKVGASIELHLGCDCGLLLSRLQSGVSDAKIFSN